MRIFHLHVIYAVIQRSRVWTWGICFIAGPISTWATFSLRIALSLLLGWCAFQPVCCSTSVAHRNAEFYEFSGFWGGSMVCLTLLEMYQVQFSYGGIDFSCMRSGWSAKTQRDFQSSKLGHWMSQIFDDLQWSVPKRFRAIPTHKRRFLARKHLSLRLENDK